MEAEETKSLPMTRVVDIRLMPEEKKSSPLQYEPEISTALQLGEYICKNKNSFPQDLLKLTEQKTNLTELVLKHLRLNADGIRHFAVVLFFFKGLLLADFTDMQLQPDDFKQIVQPLSKLVNLEELALTANNIGTAAPLLANTFQYINKLEILNLSDCYLEPNNFKNLASGLSHLKQLKLLQLSLNPIGDIGCIALCTAIMEMPALLELELFTCEITNKSVEALDKAFKKSLLRSVLLGNNKFNSKFETKLKGKYPFVHFGVEHHKCEIF